MKINIVTDKVMALVGGKSKGADVSVSTGWSSTVSYKENKLANLSSDQQTAVSVRIIKDGKFGVAATNQIDEVGLNKMISDSLFVSEFGREVNFKLPEKQNCIVPKTYDSSIEKITEEQLINRGNHIIVEIVKSAKNFSVAQLILEKSNSESVFANTNGVIAHSLSSENGILIELANIQEGDFFQIGLGNDSVKDDINTDRLIQKLLKWIADGEKIVLPKSGSYPVIFTPEAAGEWLDYLLTALNGRAVNEKTSKLSGKLGEKMFDEKLTIIDDPTIDWGVESYGLDDEGVPGQKKQLIKNGVVNSYYYDLNQASKAKVESTGNGSRGGYAQAEPSVSNISVSGGDQPYTQLLSGISKGMVVYGFIGSGQNNPYNGDFQVTVQLGYWVENGQIVGRVKNTAISGNVFELLKNRLAWISKDRETLGSVTVPYVCFDGVTVTSG